jgi:hypothetical protein
VTYPSDTEPLTFGIILLRGALRQGNVRGCDVTFVGRGSRRKLSYFKGFGGERFLMRSAWHAGCFAMGRPL